ncbi:MAG TPA: hypothetical protein VGH20_14720 [Myxococcales bacterium]|jgi:hypothetical protein
MRSFFLALAIASAATNARADAPKTNPSKCTAAEYRQLDFWVGDWDTFEPDGSGPSQARAHVDPILGNCAVHELYEQIDGLVGDSFLSYDGVKKMWQQTWLTNFGGLMQIWGNFKDGALVLEGDAHTRDGKTWTMRITWKAEAKGVRESAVRSKDGGKTWEPAFDVLFMKHR